jgi:Raf kinase inhibitor-like YbhB/YbcL family protein
MDLTSPDFQHEKLIPSQFTCDGEDVNPNLDIVGVPAEAESLVLIVDDPDANPTESVGRESPGAWIHWLLWNINPATDRIVSSALPPGVVQGKTSFETSGYGGPCPPTGTHRYFFKLYALNSTIDLPPTVGIDELKKAMDGHIIAEAELIGLYSRDTVS